MYENMYGIFFLLIFVFLIGAALHAFWRIFKRAGFNPLMSLWLLIPTIGVVVVLGALAFSRWPADGKDDNSISNL